MATPALTWAAVAALLIGTASRDLSLIDGAFGLSTGEWTVACFTAGIVVALAGAAFTALKRSA